MPFRDRHDAGRQLAERLQHLRAEDVLVLGLARGGLPVAVEVARELGAPLDAMVARKLGAPTNPEYGVGAIAPGVAVVDERAVRLLGISHAEMDQVIADETQEMERRLLRYRGTAVPPDVSGKTVVLVDDGLATGVTARAAVRALKGWGAGRVVLAVPVCAPDSAEALRAEADEVVCVEAPPDFRAVGLWYDDFRQTSDEEVVALLREAGGGAGPGLGTERAVVIPVGPVTLQGDLVVPAGAKGLVVFAHGSGSGRHSPRNKHVARRLNAAGLGTLLLDLLSLEEERVDEATRHLRFDIGLLANRLVTATDWAATQPETRDLGIGYFGASTGGGAALVAAAKRPRTARAVVSRGGRPDLAGETLPDVRAPTLLVVGGDDPIVHDLNREAFRKLRCEKALRVVEGATHLFEEPGALDRVADLAAEWFVERLPTPPPEARERRGF